MVGREVYGLATYLVNQTGQSSTVETTVKKKRKKWRVGG